MKKFKILLVVAGIISLSAIPIAAATPLSATPYRITLVEAMDVLYNKTIDAQPKFYIIGNNGDLESSETITLPAHRRIILTIISYDDGSAPVADRYTKVSGTVDGKVTIINGTIASGSNTNKTWMRRVSSVPASQIIHTFTIPELNINIPLIAGTTEIANLYINTAGSYTWRCKTACGSAPDGWGGAMAASGWMMGIVKVVQK